MISIEKAQIKGGVVRFQSSESYVDTSFMDGSKEYATGNSINGQSNHLFTSKEFRSTNRNRIVIIAMNLFSLENRTEQNHIRRSMYV